MESVDNKVRRMTRFKSQIEQKSARVDFFQNVTDVLLEALGKARVHLIII